MLKPLQLQLAGGSSNLTMPAKPDALGLKVIQHRVNKAERQGTYGRDPSRGQPIHQTETQDLPQIALS